MRMRFEKALSDPKVVNRFPDADPLARLVVLHADDYGIFMFYWYAGLHVVVEGFKELKLRDATIEQLLQSPNVDALRLVRNATFHFQKDGFISKKVIPFLKSKDSVPWVRSLTEAFSEFFLREAAKRRRGEQSTTRLRSPPAQG
jgi:hypothetical protein